jgi:hypothetical protein
MSTSYRSATVIFDRDIGEEGMEHMLTMLKGLKYVADAKPGDPGDDHPANIAKADLQHELYMHAVPFMRLFTATNLTDEERQVWKAIKGELSKLRRM